MVRANRQQRPDIVIDVDGNVVILESEHDPAATLQADVEKSLRAEISGLGHPMAAVGIKLPPEIKHCDDADLRRVLEECQNIQHYVAYPDGSRFPKTGYLRGSLAGIRTTVRLSSIPKERVERGFCIMTEAMKKISRKIENGTDAGVRKSVCASLRQNPSRQTWNMAGLVLLNAATFYEELAAIIPEIKPASSLRVTGVLSQETVVRAWRGVLGIDYAPIFESATDILASLPGGVAGEIVDVMSDAVSKIMTLRILRFGDFYGMLYQTTLLDRKSVAAFYTRPEAAVLLAGLLLPAEDDELWSDTDRVKKLKIADFACGSGTLLSAAYGHMVGCAPADMSGKHSHMMENCFYGFDIFPIATHFAVSNMAATFPDRAFDWCNIYTMPIGQKKNGYDLGSLNLIQYTEKFTKAGRRLGGKGTKDTHAASMKHESCDYIIMNPPFARATNHGAGRTDPVPPFAVFGISPKEQIRMGRHNAKLYARTCSHGNAGLASNFMAICHKKLKPGGTMGLILPNTVMSGDAWSGVRDMLNDWYDDMMLVHVGAGTYSSSTDMHETILVARKLAAKEERRSKKTKAKIKSVLLDAVPESALAAWETARAIKSTEPVRLEDNTGHTSVLVGGGTVGKSLICPVEGDLWWAGRASDTALLQFVYGLAHGFLESNAITKYASEIPISNMCDFTKMGKHSFDVTGAQQDGSPRGPFNKMPASPNSAYPCLWNNDSKTQTSMVVDPDCSLERKPDASVEHVDRVWRTATRTHINNQIRYTSQKLAVAYTNAPTLGGRSWPNAIMDESFEKAFAVWCNSTFGVLLYWAVAGSQQPGRGMMSRASFQTVFKTLDLRKLARRQLGKFDALFDWTRNDEFLPFNQLDKDPTRQELDDGIMDILGVRVDLEPVRRRIVAEPQFVGSAVDGRTGA